MKLTSAQVEEVLFAVCDSVQADLVEALKEQREALARPGVVLLGSVPSIMTPSMVACAVGRGVMTALFVLKLIELEDADENQA